MKLKHATVLNCEVLKILRAFLFLFACLFLLGGGGGHLEYTTSLLCIPVLSISFQRSQMLAKTCPMLSRGLPFVATTHVAKQSKEASE